MKILTQNEEKLIQKTKLPHLRVLIWMRTSTLDQNIDTQLNTLRDYIKTKSIVDDNKRPWKEVDFSPIDVSGISGNDIEKLAEYREDLLTKAHKREFDILLIWSTDRLSRAGLEDLMSLWFRLDKSGVKVHSYLERYTDQISDDNLSQLLKAMDSVRDTKQRENISLKTREGLARSSKPKGRPKGSKDSKKRRKDGYRGNANAKQREEPLLN